LIPEARAEADEMSQFAFLQREWPAVFEAAAKPRQEVVIPRAYFVVGKSVALQLWNPMP
jgi:hypothetical protein